MVGGAVAHPAATPERSVTALRLRSGQVFPLLRSSVRGPLSSAPFAVNLIVAVAVKEHQVPVPVIRPVTIPVMYFHHVLCRKA